MMRKSYCMKSIILERQIAQIVASELIENSKDNQMKLKQEKTQKSPISLKITSLNHKNNISLFILYTIVTKRF